MKKTMIAFCFAFILMTGVFAQNDIAIVTAVSGPTTDGAAPALAAVDGMTDTSWRLLPGSTYGWMELTLEESVLVAEISLTGNFPEKARLSFSYEGPYGRTPFLAGSVHGNANGGRLDFSLDDAVTKRIFVALEGEEASNASIGEISVRGRQLSGIVSKLRPLGVESSENTSWLRNAGNLIDGDTRTEWGSLSPFGGRSHDDEVERVWNERLAQSRSGGHFAFGWMSSAATIAYEEAIDPEYAMVYTAGELEEDLLLEAKIERRWKELGRLRAGSGPGWQRIALGGDEAAAEYRLSSRIGRSGRVAVGEFELWARERYRGRAAEELAYGIGDTESNAAVLSFDRAERKSGALILGYRGSAAASIELTLNGRAFTAMKLRDLRGLTLYELAVEVDYLWEGENFLTLGASEGMLECVQWAETLDEGILARASGSLGDKLLYTDSGIWGETLISYGSIVSLDRVEVTGAWTAPVTVYARTGNNWILLRPISSSEGIAIFDGAGIMTDSIKAVTAAGSGEILSWGSAQTKDEPRFIILSPRPGQEIEAQEARHGYLSGWISERGASVTANGVPAEMWRGYFSLSLASLSLAEGEDNPVRLRAGLKDGRIIEKILSISVDTGKTLALMDEGKIVYTKEAVYVIKGWMRGKTARVYVNGIEAEYDRGAFQKEISLREGLNLVTVTAKNRSSDRVIAIRALKIVRSSGGPKVFLESPRDGETLASATAEISGRVRGLNPLAVTVNGRTAAVEGGRFRYGAFPLADGQNTIEVTATDTLKRTTTTVARVTRDTAAPAILSVTPPQGTIVNTANVIMKVAIADSGASWARANGGAWVPVIEGIATLALSLPEGMNEISIQAKDAAGNTASLETTLIADLSPPEPFTVTAFPAGWTNVKRPVLSFTASDAVTSIVKYELSVDGALRVEVTSPHTLAELSDGIHSVIIIATDAAGWERTATTTVKIDTIAPPEPLRFRPVPGKDSILLKWTGSGEEGENYRVERDPAFADGIRDASGESYADGGHGVGETYQYRIWAVDRAGNESPKSAWKGATAGYDLEPIVPGGTVGEYQGAVVVAPPGAFEEDVTALLIGETPLDTYEAQPLYPTVSPVYSIMAMKAGEEDSLVEHVSLSAQALLRFSYDPSALPEGYPEENLKIYYFDEFWSRWLPVEETGIDVERNEAYCLTGHFTDYTVQATAAQELSPQEMRTTASSPFGTNKAHAPVRVNPKEGTVSTEFAEFVLPGIDGLDLTIKRTYDTSTARSDAPNASYFGTTHLNVWSAIGSLDNPDNNMDKKRDEYGNFLADQGSDPAALTPIEEAKQDGDYPWFLGSGWRLNMPSMKWVKQGIWIRGIDGEVLSFAQMTMVSESAQGTDSNLLYTYSFESHESADLRVRIEVRQFEVPRTVFFFFQGHRDKYEIHRVELLYKDGRSVEYDDKGRVTEIRSRNGGRAILFAYDESTELATTIIDSLGRTISFGYTTPPKTNVRPCIETITVSGGGESYPTVEYQYGLEDSFPRLVKATDVAGREWNYGYKNLILLSGGGGNGAQVIGAVQDLAKGVGSQSGTTWVDMAEETRTYAGVALGAGEVAIFGWIQFELVTALETLEGKGIGHTAIQYGIKDIGAAEGDFQERTYATILTLGLNAETALRTTNYGYDFQLRDYKQTVNAKSTVNDGRTLTETTYAEVWKDRIRMSPVPSEIQRVHGWTYGTEPDTPELRSYPSTVITKIPKTDVSEEKVLETQTQGWDTDRMRMTSTITARSAQNWKSEQYSYDFWGNLLSKTTESLTGTRRSKLEESYAYYNSSTLVKIDTNPGTTSFSALTAEIAALAPEVGTLPAPLSLTEPTLSRGQKDLIAVKKTTAYAWTPLSDGPESFAETPDDLKTVKEYEAYTYTGLGQMASKHAWTSQGWAKTDYEYYPILYPNTSSGSFPEILDEPWYSSTMKNAGHLKKETAPERGITEYEYMEYSFGGFSADIQARSATKYYKIMTTKKHANLGNVYGIDIRSESVFRRLTGMEVWTKDGRGYATSKSFDFLDRPTSIIEPAVGDATFAYDVLSAEPPDRPTNPKTMITYNDGSTAPSATITYPGGGTSVYSYDALGRLSGLARTSAVNSELTPGGAAATETISAALVYDAYDQVSQMKGPVSDKDPDKTIESYITDYTYDKLGRLLTTKLPGTLATEFKENVYDDVNGDTLILDELRNATRQAMDWAGNVLSKRSVVDGVKIESYTYYDGKSRVVMERDPNGNSTSRAYNPSGLLARSMLCPRPIYEIGNTNTTAYPIEATGYDLEGRAISAVRMQTYAATQTPETVHETRTEYNTLDLPLRVIDTVTVDGAQKTILVTNAYDINGNIVSKTSGYANEALDEYGRTFLKYEAGSASMTSWTYDARGRIRTETNGESKITTYEYDARGNKTKITDPREALTYSGRFSMDLEYDQFNRLVKAVLPNIEDAVYPEILFRYDGHGNVTQRQEKVRGVASGQSTSYSYSSTTDGRYLLHSETKTGIEVGTTLSLTTSYAYDAARRKISQTSPSGMRTTFQYDGLNRLRGQGIENTDSVFVNYEWMGLDPNGNIVKKTDSRYFATDYEYGSDNLLRKTTDAKGGEFLTDYDPWGHATRSIDAEGNVRTQAYDEIGRLIRETTPTGETLSYAYDPRGNVTKFTDARGISFLRTYTKTNKLLTETATKVIDLITTTLGTRTYTYDEGGDIKSIVDAQGANLYYNGAETPANYAPDPFGLVRKQTRTVDGRTIAMSYAYDAQQRLSGVTYPNLTAAPIPMTSTYAYNGLGQLKGMPGWINADSVHYTTGGLLDDYTQANGMKTDMAYDTCDRISSLSHTKTGMPSKNYSFSYDAMSNITVKNQNAYEYDELNRLNSANESGWFQNAPGDVIPYLDVADRDYDAQEEMVFSAEVTAELESPLRFDYAARSIGIDLRALYGVNRIELKSDSATHRIRTTDIAVYAIPENETEYKPIERFKIESLSDGSFDIRMEEIVFTRYLKITCGWDDRNIENESVDCSTFKKAPAALVQVWTLSRTRNETYEYDGIGNRQKLSTALGAFSPTEKSLQYYQNGNVTTPGNTTRLKFDGDWYYQYDASGNTITRAKNLLGDKSNISAIDTSKEYWQYEWDAWNRLTRVKKNGTAVASYAYDALNFRIMRTGAVASDKTYYAYGRQGALTYTYEPAKGKERKIAYFGSSIIGWEDRVGSATERRFAVTDNLGSVTQVRDTDGKVLWESEYLAYGEKAGEAGSMDFDGLYTGKDIDPDTGLRYHWNRWTSPDGSRFMSEDPARDGVNWYGYCGGNPVNATDPSGLFPGRDGRNGIINRNQYNDTMAQMVDHYSTKMAPEGADFSWSIISGTFTSAYGPRVYIDNNNELVIGFHFGIDIICNTQTPGQSFYAITDGTVIFAGIPFNSTSSCIIIRDSEGREWSYMHGDNFIVQAGDKISAGRKLGDVSDVGPGKGPHLHLGVKLPGGIDETDNIDPLEIIGRRPDSIKLGGDIIQNGEILENRNTNAPPIPQYPIIQDPSYKYRGI